MPSKCDKKSIIQSSIAVVEPKNISFSFEHYDTNREYCLSNWEKEQIALTLNRLKDINNKTFNQMTRESKVYHFHQVVWEDTIKQDGFPEPLAKKLPAFLFALLGVNGQKARVYGALLKDIFYIVWFDFNHEIWPTMKKNT